MQSIEKLKNQHRTSDAIFEGMKVRKGWKPGKEVEEEEYVDAVNDFLNAPADGVVREEAKG